MIRVPGGSGNPAYAEAVIKAEPQVLVFWDQGQGVRVMTHTLAGIGGLPEDDAELLKFYEEVLPADLSAARRILYPRLDQLARKVNLTPGAYRFHPDVNEAGDLRKITMTMNLTGEYTSVRRFIHELETAPEFVVLESVAVTTAAEGDRRLNVVAQVATYYRAPEHGN